jgi:diguanylate cyclase (GGDEF)-like protein
MDMPTALVVDDSEDNAKLLEYDLNDDGFGVLTALSGDECITTAATQRPDIILLDMRMPGLSGLETLEKLKTFPETNDIPVIIISASSADDNIIQALDLGANDYVNKPVVYPILAARMRTALRLKQATMELEIMNHELRRLATTDPLTRLSNRRHFFSLANAEFSKAQRHNRPLSIIMMDVDEFKMLNDTYGHAAGDKALDILADCCREAVRESDLVGRIGGEEFAICCPDADLQGASVIAERIRTTCERRVVSFGERTFTFTVSLGVTCRAKNDSNFDDMLNRADQLLYQAKGAGRNKAVAY